MKKNSGSKILYGSFWWNYNRRLNKLSKPQLLNFLKNEFYKFNKYIKCKLRSTNQLEMYKKDFLYTFVTNV